VITWANPPAITYGMALTNSQLDATANVPGSFGYSPALTTVLGAGTQTLNVIFTPADAADYTTASAAVARVVNRASTSMVLGSSSNPSLAGQTLTLTVTILPQFGGVATGSVAFTAPFAGCQHGRSHIVCAVWSLLLPGPALACLPTSGTLRISREKGISGT
jgi:hypothetical protein